MLLQRNRVGVISAGVAMGAIALGVTPGIAHADPYVPCLLYTSPSPRDS